MQLTQNPVTNSISNHIGVRQPSLCLRELVHKGDMSVTHVPSEYQHADTLTKALVNDVFVAHRKCLMKLSE